MSKPNLKEIEWAIDELENKESSFSNYAKLASLYTCRNEMRGTHMQEIQPTGYSESGPPREPLGAYGDSEFLLAVEGKDPSEAWAVMDELMTTLQVVNRRAYDTVIRKLNNL